METIQQQKSIDYFDSNVRSEIEQGIIEALDENDGYEIEIAYDVVSQKFTRSLHQIGLDTESDEIIVARIEPWSILDQEMDISMEELLAMDPTEKEYIASNCAEEWVEQYDHAVEQARKLIQE